INGSDDSDPDVYVYPFAPSPAPKFPLVEGYTRISQENVLKFFKINYTITLNYKYNEKIFDFI
ncbi:MAG: hypothetical protein M3Z80_09725, partial [Apibacter sp.]|uniref:hypothetical protein n=1 Tax=Apibacter sp. TaxID=2023709 RepID=UPI0025DC4B2E